jgi:HEAT repeat protein
MRRIAAGLLLSMLFSLSSCSPDPSKPEYWEKRIGEAKGKKDKLRAVEELRSSKHLTPVIYPLLYKRLELEKSSEVKAAIVRLLGEQKDKGAVDALAATADFGAGDTDARTMNKEIAIALGRLGDPTAAPTLIKLLGTKDNFTMVASIEALGELRAKEGYEALARFVTDDTAEPFVTKKAVVALGEIGDPRAVPSLLKLMFKERRGVSFYGESSFALYQLGRPAGDAALPLLEGKDKALSSWAEKNGIIAEALVAKAAQLLGDLHDERAEKGLISLLGYKSQMVDITLFVRMGAADALGRLRSKEGAKVLANMLGELEGNAREKYVWAVSRIGGRDTLAKLIESAPKGSWDARTESIKGIALLGDERELPALEKLSQDEPSTFEAECKSEEIGGHPHCEDLAGGVKKHQDTLAQAKATLEVAKECQADAACWAKKLADPSPLTRERAAYEVGRSGNAALVSELTRRLRESDLDVRLAIIQGVDWLVTDSKEAQKAAQAALPDLVKQLAEERGRTEFQKVNEDLRRLPVKIARG